MRLVSMLVLLPLAACAAKPIYRTVEGAPTTVYWQCKDNPKSGEPDAYGGGKHPCPTLVDVYCGANREHYVVVVEAMPGSSRQLPKDPNEMCARIDHAQ
jgi:hypothetical protein